MRLGTLTLFHLTSISFTAIALLCYPFVDSDPWAIVNPDTIRTGFLMAAIFTGGCTIVDLVFYRRRPKVRDGLTLEPTATSMVIFTAIFILGFIGFLRFYFGAGAWRYFGSVLISVLSGGGYYDTREAIADVLVAQLGKGVAHGTTAVYITVPVVVAAGLFTYFRHHRGYYLNLAVLAAVQGVLTVGVFMERAPVLYALIFPLIAYLASKHRMDFAGKLLTRASKKIIITGSMIFVSLGLMIYSWTDVGENPLTSLLSRIFLSPCITANYYIAAFPDEFAFRGWTKIGLMGATLGGPDVGTRDIAAFVTGGRYFYNPNSGILATAYSGAGLSGCAIMTGIYLVLVTVVDWLFRRYPADIRMLNLIMNLYSIPMLGNTPMLAAIFSGFVTPSFLFLLFLVSCRRSLPTPASP